MKSAQHTERSRVSVRRARRDDAPALLALIEALAAYEHLTPPDEAAKKRLVDDLFSVAPRLEGFLVEFQGRVIGYALVFETYSSFLALPTLYLEDIFVLPEYRGRKAGKSLFLAMVEEARRRGCGRMEWQVLDWNTSAIDFYDHLGARQLKGWLPYRIDRSGMDSLLSSASDRG